MPNFCDKVARRFFVPYIHLDNWYRNICELLSLSEGLCAQEIIIGSLGKNQKNFGGHQTVSLSFQRWRAITWDWLFWCSSQDPSIHFQWSKVFVNLVLLSTYLVSTYNLFTTTILLLDGPIRWNRRARMGNRDPSSTHFYKLVGCSSVKWPAWSHSIF